MGRPTLRQLMIGVLACSCLIMLWSTTKDRKSMEPVETAHVKINRHIQPSLDVYQGNHYAMYTQRQYPNITVQPPQDMNLNQNRTVHILTNASQHQNLSTPSGVKVQRKVILVSYMRSGSTFAGDLFQLSKDVFYFYEPLLYTNDMDLLPRGTLVKSRTRLRYGKMPNLPEVETFIQGILNCDMNSSNLQFLIGLAYSQSMKDYLSCKKTGSDIKVDEQCAKSLVERCKKSKIILAKILRFHMWEVDGLLSRDPELKVIHLVRDPRGVYVSRHEASYYLSSSSFCKRLNADSEMSASLQSKYSGRILTIRYEDLARSPVDMTRLLYDFVGVQWSDDVKSRVMDLTSPKATSFQENKFSTRRKNSTATAFQWRQKISFKHASFLQRACKPAMEKYGYVELHSLTDLQNTNHNISFSNNYSDVYFKAIVRDAS